MGMRLRFTAKCEGCFGVMGGGIGTGIGIVAGTGTGIGTGIGIGWPPHRHFDRSEAEWRNLPAEWDWWMSAPDGAVAGG